MKDGQQGAGVRGKSRAIRAGFGARTLVAIACSVLLAFVVGACGDDKGASNENANWMSPDGELGGSLDQVGSSVAGDARPSDGALTDKGKAPDEIAAPARPAPRVLFLGDSLSAGLHLPANEAFPAVLQERLALDGIPFDLVNAGVSGDTTAGGLARLDWLLRQNPDLVVVELGANDGLRGVDLASIESNLRQIIAKLQAKDLPVLLLGMRLPPNYGADYTEGFQDVYAKIADDTNVRFVPFFLEGVAGDPNLNLPDGIHPTTKGHQLIAGHLKPILTEMVQALDD